MQLTISLRLFAIIDFADRVDTPGLTAPSSSSFAAIDHGIRILIPSFVLDDSRLPSLLSVLYKARSISAAIDINPRFSAVLRINARRTITRDDPRGEKFSPAPTSRNDKCGEKCH